MEKKEQNKAGQKVIAERGIQTLDDFLQYFAETQAASSNLEKELANVRAALPDSIWATVGREPWKYWEALTGKPWENPSPYEH